MLTLILAFLAFILIFTLMAYFLGRWVSRYIQSMITSRVDAINQIVNEGRVPEAWIKRYRRRRAKLEAAGADDARVKKLKLRARKRVLTNMERLMHYVRETGITDTPETKQMVLTELERQAQRWRLDNVWLEVLDREPAEATESPREEREQEEEGIS